MPDLEREYAFLSYAHENLKQVLKVYEDLKKRKVNVWIDKKNLGIGRWKPQILKAISRSKYFVICLSNAAIKKTSSEKPGFQDEELQIAWEFAREQDERGFTIIPIRLEDCGRGDMRLSGWQQYDLFEDWEGVLDKLAVNLGGNSLSDAMAIDERKVDEKILESIMHKAAIFYYSGEYEKSLSIFESAINVKPEYAEAWNSKGVALSSLGNYEEALEAFNKSIKIKRDNPNVWSNRGFTLIMLNRHEEALEDCDNAIKIKRDYFEAWINKGNALSNLGQNDKALEAHDKALEINPGDNNAWANKGYILSNLNRNEEAIEACNKAIEINHDNYRAWNHKGIAFSNLGQYNKALEFYNKAIKIEPNCPEAWTNKGNVFTNLGQYDKAIEFQNKAIEINPDFNIALYNLACIYSLKKQKDRALKYLQMAIDKGFNHLWHIKENNDLDFIRNEKEFKEIINKL
jgi:tetratricopeptide (TPR) repeat protein